MFTSWQVSTLKTNIQESVNRNGALGVKSNKALGIAAGTMWVLKDALGKVSRILWASNFGRKFDQDSKKWRFRSSIIFATGSLFEILTYLRPQVSDV